MKGTFLFTIVFLLTCLFSEAQEKQINRTDNEGLRQGYWEQRYPNGNIRYKGVFRDGKPVGELLRYYTDGNKMAVMNFDETGTKAEAELFYENGFTAAKGNYVNEQRDSIWHFYSQYDEGLLMARENYRTGDKHGVSVIYFPNGEISQKLTYRNDLRHGEWKQFYMGGTLKLEGHYENGSREGDFAMYTPEGRTEVEGYYEDNLMHGEWKFFDREGELLYTLVYNKGYAENEEELIMKEQEFFRFIEEQKGKIPEPDETDRLFRMR